MKLTNEAVTAAKTTRKIIKDVLANIPAPIRQTTRQINKSAHP